MVFEHQRSHTSPFLYAGDNTEQVEEFKYLGMVLKYSRTLISAIEYLCKAATQGPCLLRCGGASSCIFHDPHIECKLFDTLVKASLCYCCEIWAIFGNKTNLDKLEHIQPGYLKRLLVVQTQTTNLHVLAEFERFPLQLSWQALAGTYMDRLDNMDEDRLLKQVFIADCLPPSHGNLAANASFTTSHRQLRTRPMWCTVDSAPFHRHNLSIYSSLARGPPLGAKLAAKSK